MIWSYMLKITIENIKYKKSLCVCNFFKKSLALKDKFSLQNLHQKKQ